MASVRLGQLVRQFSTTAASKALVKPPIQVFGLEGRYATALYSAASKEKKLNEVEKDLQALTKVLQSDIKFTDFISDPSTHKDAKKEALAAACKKMSLSPVTQNLCDLLVDNNRMKLLPAVASSFGEIMAVERGELTCKVVSAKPLDANSMKQIQAALNGFAKKGQKLQIETEVDPTLIGGLKVTIGDKFVDMSIASRLRVYTDILKTAL